MKLIKFTFNILKFYNIWDTELFGLFMAGVQTFHPHFVFVTYPLLGHLFFLFVFHYSYLICYEHFWKGILSWYCVVDIGSTG